MGNGGKMACRCRANGKIISMALKYADRSQRHRGNWPE